MKEYFLEGDLVGLRPPDIDIDIHQGEWHQWFNREHVTKHLVHGVYPNTIESQEKYIKMKLADTSSVILCIENKIDNELIGVVSLDGIDLINRVSEIAIVIGVMKYPLGAPLEAMALMTTHGFEKLNLNKIQAGQHVGLWKWVNTLELIGYRLEGYISQTHTRVFETNDSVRVGITMQRYKDLLTERKGNYLTDDIVSLMKGRRKENMCDTIKSVLKNLYEGDKKI